MSAHYLKLDPQIHLLEMLIPPQSNLSQLSCLVPDHLFTKPVVQWNSVNFLTKDHMLAYCPLLLALKAAPYLPTETAPILLSKPSGKCRLKDLNFHLLL